MVRVLSVVSAISAIIMYILYSLTKNIVFLVGGVVAGALFVYSYWGATKTNAIARCSALYPGKSARALAQQKACVSDRMGKLEQDIIF